MNYVVGSVNDSPHTPPTKIPSISKHAEPPHPLFLLPNDEFISGANLKLLNTNGGDLSELKSAHFEQIGHTSRAASTNKQDLSIPKSQIEPLTIPGIENGKKRQLDDEESEENIRKRKKKPGESPKVTCQMTSVNSRASPFPQPVKAESVGTWETWWRENTVEMAALLTNYTKFDAYTKMECVMLARSAKIYQRLVVYICVQMKAFPGVHESFNSLRETLSGWAEWDELQWLARHHVVRRTLWDKLRKTNTVSTIPLKMACNMLDIMNFDMSAIHEKVMTVLNDREVKKKFLGLCQSDPIPVANLFQTLLDQNNLPTEHRSQLARTLARLAKSSRCYPDCLLLSTIRRTGTDPVAGGGFADSVQERVLKLSNVTQEFAHEAVIWRQLKHPNILPFYGVFKGDELFDRLCLVSPWMDAGNVIDYLNVHPDSDRLSLLSDVARGLEYLHLFQPPIIHGDLKGANIFVSPSLTACLGDFGLARFRDSQESTLGATTGNATGTLRWQAPELLTIGDEGESICRSEKCDIYSFGCVCLELMTGKPPFPEIRNDGAVMMAIAKGQTPQRPLEKVFERGLDNKLWALMQECWNVYPALRPRTGHLVEYFQLRHGATTLGVENSEDPSPGVRASLGKYGFPDGFVSHVSNFYAQAESNGTIQPKEQSGFAAALPRGQERSNAIPAPLPKIQARRKKSQSKVAHSRRQATAIAKLYEQRG
ncbi:kinase-like protein [Rickenella mellea]|uniref:Kinase-like protein n=1 Tax=Rickenella mellea TaxID=50990 RepID=A0A4Y7Q3C8_9AGAM|nr:kinase-like protein [Rickenella mellea]